MGRGRALLVGGGLAAVAVLGAIGWAVGIDPALLVQGGNQLSPPQLTERALAQTSAPSGTMGVPKDPVGRFVSQILGATEVIWGEIFSAAGMQYRKPIVVLYKWVTDSPCQIARSVSGPFYCPVDQKVYLDPEFFERIEKDYRGCDASGCQFASAYIIAHEIAHHVQYQLGILGSAHELKQKFDPVEANKVSVQVELQADCLAGVWAFHGERKWKFLEGGDVEAALRTASAIGNDALQKRATGHEVPDSFTHGTSEQRQRWFNTGLKTGVIPDCDIFTKSTY